MKLSLGVISNRLECAPHCDLCYCLSCRRLRVGVLTLLAAAVDERVPPGVEAVAGVLLLVVAFLLRIERRRSVRVVTFLGDSSVDDMSITSDSSCCSERLKRDAVSKGILVETSLVLTASSESEVILSRGDASTTSTAGTACDLTGVYAFSGVADFLIACSSRSFVLGLRKFLRLISLTFADCSFCFCSIIDLASASASLLVGVCEPHMLSPSDWLIDL